ncbi:MAG: hypothetical protein FWG18_02955 [Alphaproteobacteria bacterium]|nr:hypothetical protein [Alphaproteobacteria bacterium]
MQKPVKRNPELYNMMKPLRNAKTHEEKMHVIMDVDGIKPTSNNLNEHIELWTKMYNGTVALFNYSLPNGLSKDSALFRTTTNLLYYRDWILIGVNSVILNEMTQEQKKLLNSMYRERNNMLDRIISYCLEGVRVAA